MKHLSFWDLNTHLFRLETTKGTRFDGQFYWGGTLLKGNAGVQRCTKLGWKSRGSCNGKSALDCESVGSNRCESRS